ncbi:MULTISPECIES: amino acid ABC transporter permease [Devosia]|uniref:Amino acid ABC transporter permease n=1 Tax=Devosia ginsengisoli TaxID=400770 RepID=A0A5B8LPN3_9HYPH|nr:MULTISPECIES: amino acid ABC transporter permease [Devosia]KRA50744.1 amino acid ABC transporter permease [Devosia sp. Root635]QDZ10041.1 amino acid ABC transporter permease [Devosia ginsengisoli]
MTDLAFVRSDLVDAKPPPHRTSGAWAWAQKNLFATPLDTLLTVLGILFLLWVVPPIYNFFIGHAVGPNGTVEECRMETAGACWAYISSEMEFFIYGFYDIPEHWRPNIVFALGALLFIPLLMPKVPFKRTNAVLFLFVYPIVSYYLLAGGVFGLKPMPTEKWGGLLVTLIISVVGITLSFPIGIVLALGRQSKMPVIKTLCIGFIELVRAVPLISVLFMASIMLPLFMPQGMTIDKLLRALVGVTLFTSAYMAEVVRGGLQAIPRGQYEAGASLGLGYWQRMYFIILPQALKHVIPGIVNSFIALFKDTSLVYIVGMKDLLEAVKTKNDTALEWQSANTATTGYLFAAMVFWVFCFGMSRYSIFMERRLNTGYKR